MTRNNANQSLGAPRRAVSTTAGRRRPRLAASPRFLAILTAALLLWAPLPFASVAVGARLGLTAGVWLLFLLALWTVQRRRPKPPQTAILLMLGLVAVGVVQFVPLPAGLVRLLSPLRFRLSDSAAEVLGPVESFLSLSLTPGVTVTVTFWLATLTAAIYVGAVAGRERTYRRVVAASVVLAAVLQGLYGASRLYTDPERIWGLEVAGAGGRLRGTFVNPDHLAFYVGLSLPIVFAWCWWAFNRARRFGRLPALIIGVAPPALLWCVLFVFLALSGSRGGLAAAALAVTVQGGLVALSVRRWWLVPIGLVAAIVGLAAVAMTNSEVGLGRVASTSSYEMRWNKRFEVYDASLGLVPEAPLLGTGFGSFRDAFPVVQPQGLGGTWWHAHSDWLEVLVTGGLVGLVLVGLLFVTGVRRLLRVFQYGRRSEDRAAGLAGLGFSVAAGAHSLVDFGSTMPANALTLAILFGLATSCSLSLVADE